MSGSVDQVEAERLAGFVGVSHASYLELDGDATLALEVHVVEELLLHLTLLDGSGGLEELIGESGLAVVDVGDDAEVADVGDGDFGEAVVAELGGGGLGGAGGLREDVEVGFGFMEVGGFGEEGFGRGEGEEG